MVVNMREYLIFKTEMCSKVYIDAYRTDDKPINWVGELQIYLDEFAFVWSESRTEAKRCAWKNWIDKDLIGFKEWHERLMNTSELNKV